MMGWVHNTMFALIQMTAARRKEVQNESEL
jgi:hypothetical protein